MVEYLFVLTQLRNIIQNLFSNKNCQLMTSFRTGCGISNDSNRTIWSKNFADFKQVLPFRDPESSLLISHDISGFRMTADGFLTGKRVNYINMEASTQFEDFVKIIKNLRKKCPWDRKQTHKSLKGDLIEEAYETVDAIDREDAGDLKKELGDLLLHVVFHSQIAFEYGDFTIDDVIQSIQEKMIFRHPHVFGDARVGKKEQSSRIGRL
jgi:NTP pyrophosphatase (non-canonical NTP hydrolase)